MELDGFPYGGAEPVDIISSVHSLIEIRASSYRVVYSLACILLQGGRFCRYNRFIESYRNNSLLQVQSVYIVQSSRYSPYVPLREVIAVHSLG